MELKDYAIGTLTIIVLMSLGIQVTDDTTHICRDSELTYHCDSLSKYYGLENGKCINNIMPNKLCRSGWEEINFNKPIDVNDNKLRQVCCHVDGTCTEGAC